MTLRTMLTAAGLLAAAASLGCNGGGLFGSNGGNGATGRDEDEILDLKQLQEQTAAGTYTVLLNVHSNPQTHFRESKLWKERLEESTNWSDLFVVHEGGHSQLYWGKYPSIAKARENLQKAKEYTTPAGEKVFRKAMIVSMPGEEVGPKEWNLENSGAAYTVLVAVFYDEPHADYVGRKQFAVAYCRQLREDGLEAYYYHGPARSGVTVGAFGPRAIARTHDPVTGKPQFDIRNPEIKRILAMPRFEYLPVNGYREWRTLINRQTGRKERVVQRPSVVAVEDFARKKPQTGSWNVNGR
jgi:hypothetical protein